MLQMQASKIKIVPLMTEFGFSFMMYDFGMIQWRVIGLLKKYIFYESLTECFNGKSWWEKTCLSYMLVDEEN
jgi:hypothetical protein